MATSTGFFSTTQGATATENCTYDPVGNRLSDLTASGWSNNASNELNSRPGLSCTVDNNGNELTKVNSTETTSYSWDHGNRLTSVTLLGTGGTASFKYDPFGRRIYKSWSSATSVFADDGGAWSRKQISQGRGRSLFARLHIDEPLAMSAVPLGAANGSDNRLF